MANLINVNFRFNIMITINIIFDIIKSKIE